MQLSLILLLGLIAIFCYRGYRSGLFVILSKVIGLLGAYVAALLFTPAIAIWIQTLTPLQGFLSYAAAGLLIFIVVSTAISLVSSLLIKRLTQNNPQPSQLLRLSGAVLGGLVGMAVGLIAVWLLTTIAALYQARTNQPIEKPSSFQQSVSEAAGSVIESVVSSVAEQPDMARATAVLLANPAENIGRFQRLSQAGKLQNVLNSNQARMALDASDPGALMRQPVFQELVNDADFIELSKQLKLSSQPQQMQQQVANKITKLWTQVRLIKNDPEFVAIIEDPQFKQTIQSGNTYKMLNDAKMAQLIRIISSVEVPELDFTNSHTGEDGSATRANHSDQNQQSWQNHQLNTNPDNTTQIYRWVDEKGIVHYSEKPKDDDN